MKTCILEYFSVIVFFPPFRTRKGCQTRYYFGFYDLESYVSQEGSFHKIVLSCPLKNYFEDVVKLKLTSKAGSKYAILHLFKTINENKVLIRFRCSVNES